jgi:NADPH-dependent 2,4-dienoyl-CoA reductase/sulfur reductase-like enzyme
MVVLAVKIRRRYVLASGLALPFVATPFLAKGQSKGRVVVVGGGFGGATAARFLKQYDPALDVTLLEPNAAFIACPFSNLVIAGERGLDAQRFGYGAIQTGGVTVATASAVSIDTAMRIVTASNGSKYPYDRLILSPGIDIIWGGLPGYDENASNRMPHAWKAGAQTQLLRRQLQEMPDGGVVVISVPPNPYRCPPGPYERASLIAWYLKAHKPKSKVLVLDAKDVFSKQKLFQNAWKQLYPGLLEWVSLSDGGKVVRVDPATKTFETDFGSHRADVGIVVPPQRAGAIAAQVGVADRSGWCPIDPVTFESRLVRGVHVIGDSTIAGAMPKSAFAANAQGKVCAEAIVALLQGGKPQEPRLINTCYSVAAPDYGFSVAGVYRPVNGVLTEVEGSGGTSPLDAPESQRVAEAQFGERWFQTITAEVFG